MRGCWCFALSSLQKGLWGLQELPKDFYTHRNAILQDAKATKLWVMRRYFGAAWCWNPPPVQQGLARCLHFHCHWNLLG